MHYSQVEKVIRLAGEDKGVPIGALTGDNRDLWADVCDFLGPFMTTFKSIYPGS